MAERFFWSLKHEWTNHAVLADRDAAKQSAFEYVVTFSNAVRVHQTLHYPSPDQFEADHAPAVAV